MAEDDQGRRYDRPGRRRLVVALAVGAAIVAIGVPAALAGQRQPDVVAAPADLPPPPPLPVDPSLPPLEQQPDGIPSALITDPVKGMPALAGCPVQAPRLLAALRASDLSPALAAAPEVADIDCFADYALAQTGPAAAERATVVFRFTEATGSWRAISADPAKACERIPEDVRKHLQRCG